MTIESSPLRYASQPDAEGRFGKYGGKFVSETLMSALADLEQMYRRLSEDADFQREFDEDLAHYVGRPSPLYEARRWSDEIGGARIFLKREDLNHTGAHKVNNTVGQALLAKHMGKPGSSPRPAPDSTAWPARPSPRASAWSATCSWGRRTCSASPSTSTA
jgi:tryptophan synthase beta chain